jgi:uncharacterized membrane protein YcjF (UPF0283 family)
MRPTVLICFLFFVSCVTLWLLQLWFDIWSKEAFYKIFATDVAVCIVVIVAVFLKSESKASKKLENDESLK